MTLTWISCHSLSLRLMHQQSLVTSLTAWLTVQSKVETQKRALTCLESVNHSLANWFVTQSKQAELNPICHQFSFRISQCQFFRLPSFRTWLSTWACPDMQICCWMVLCNCICMGQHLVFLKCGMLLPKMQTPTVSVSEPDSCSPTVDPFAFVAITFMAFAHKKKQGQLHSEFD